MKLLFPLCVFLSFSLQAEYRVYQYSVKLRTSPPNDPISYKKISTLDPVSFIAYNGGRSSVKIDLLRTWMCFGNTGNKKKICPPPASELINELASKTQDLK
ncbi:MAG: hypothetical protein H6622_06035 [Halobacteriovoraceae bacterium]|nr:hypothetical protein [Halobacteriovoraceae bacterium]